MRTASVSSTRMVIAAAVVVIVVSVDVVSCVLQHCMADLADSLSKVNASAGRSAATAATAFLLVTETVVMSHQPYALAGRYVR